MALSPRLAAIVDALPLRPGMRVLEVRARQRIAAALTPEGQLFIDGGDPLKEVKL